MKKEKKKRRINQFRKDKQFLKIRNKKVDKLLKKGFGKYLKKINWLQHKSEKRILEFSVILSLNKYGLCTLYIIKNSTFCFYLLYKSIFYTFDQEKEEKQATLKYKPVKKLEKKDKPLRKKGFLRHFEIINRL